MPLNFPIKIGGLEHKILGWSGPKKTGPTQKFCPPIAMGEFNSNVLAQKIAKKGKDWTSKNYCEPARKLHSTVVLTNILSGKNVLASLVVELVSRNIREGRVGEKSILTN